MTTALNRDQPKCSQDMMQRLAIAFIIPAIFVAATIPDVPDVVSVMVEESEAPAESEEETQEAREECFVSSERRFHTAPTHRHWFGHGGNTIHVTTRRRSATTSMYTGHRLAHELLAPMTC